MPETPPSLRPFRAGLWFGGWNGLTWQIGLGTPMVLLAEQLGASTLEVGLAASCVFLLLPVQVLSTATLARLGFKRQMVLGWSLRALFLLVPAALAFAAPAQPAPWMAHALVASVFGFCLFRAFGSAGHIPWLAAILPIEVRGRYFATDNSITSAVGVGTLLLCAALFAGLAAYDAFLVCYGIALSGSFMAVVNLLRLPAPPPPRPIPLRALRAEARRLFARPGAFRSYLLLSVVSSLVTSSLMPFAVYYLKVQARFGSDRILLLTASQFAGAIVGSWAIRHAIDRAAISRFFQLGALLVGTVDLYWVVYLAGPADLTAGLPLAFLGFGVATGIWNAAHLTFLPELAPDEERRPVAIACFTAALGLVAGLAPTAWGLVLQRGGPEPGIHVPRFVLFFALGLGLSALLVALFARLHDTRAGERGGSR